MKIQEEVKNVVQKILEEKQLISDKGYICFSASPITAIMDCSRRLERRFLSGPVFYGQGKPDAALPILYEQ